MKFWLLLFTTYLYTSFAGAQTLTVTGFSPLPNATSVPGSAPVSITFSEPIGAGAASIRVVGTQHRGTIAGTLTTTDRTITFTPAQPFLPGENITVTIPTTVQSAAGAPLAAAQVAQFTAATTAGAGHLKGKTLLPSKVIAGKAEPNDQQIVTADVDGDGDLDVLSVKSINTPGVINVFLNNGDGIFTQGSPVSVSDYASHIQVVDVDSDGDLDLVTGGNKINIRLNDGHGVFSGTINIDQPAYSMAFADMDGDGDPDLLLITGTGTLQLLWNDGTGHFQKSNASFGQKEYSAIVFGDVDQDGDLDVIGANYGQGVKVYLNSGAGSFTPVEVNTDTNSSYTPVALADMDGDGDVDLLANGSDNRDFLAGPRLWLLRNDGRGKFIRQGSLTDNGIGRTLDVDGDGDLDVVAVNRQTGVLNLLVNSGTGTFTQGTTIATGSNATDLEVADLDGDGDLDVLVVAGRTHLYFNQPLAPPVYVTSRSPARNRLSASFASQVAVGLNRALPMAPGTSAQLQLSSTQRGHLSGRTTPQDTTLTFDPTEPLLPGECVSVSVTATDRTGNSVLTQPHVYQFTNAVHGGIGKFSGGATIKTDPFFYRVIPADVDGDGDMDLISCIDGLGPRLEISLNQGNGTFPTKRTVSLAGLDLGDFALADVDGDGDIDLLVGSGVHGYTASPGRVIVRYNDGKGFFPTGTSLNIGNTTSAMAVGDIDGDGDVDVLTANGTRNVALNLNKGDGTFESTMVTNLDIASANNMLLLDVDNDGDLDVLASGGDVIRMSLNNGDGTFQDVTRTPLPNASRFTSADVDNDGDLDLLVSTTTRLVILLNDGHGSFTPKSSFVRTQAAGAMVATGDIDADGDVDIVMGGGTKYQDITVYLNDGQAGFQTSYTQSVAPQGRELFTVALADVDSDGSLDLVAGHSSYFSTVGDINIRLNRIGPDIDGFSPTSGRVGSVVTVTGTNLDGVTTVTLNGAPATTITPISSTSFSFVVPAGAVSGLIGATTPLGSTDSRTTFLLLLEPFRLTSVSPASAPMNSPALELTVTGENFDQGSMEVFFRGVGVPVTYISATQLTVVLPATGLTTPGIYPLTVRNLLRQNTATLDFTVSAVTATPLATRWSEVMLYPNPAQGAFTVQGPALLTSRTPVALDLLNTVGQVVATASLQRVGQQSEAVITTTHLTAGVYTLRLHLPTGVLTKVIMLQ